jgi:hypothetical protein
MNDEGGGGVQFFRQQLATVMQNVVMGSVNFYDATINIGLGFNKPSQKQTNNPSWLVMSASCRGFFPPKQQTC